MRNPTPKYLNYLLPNLFDLFKTERTKEILSVNPTVIPTREEAAQVVITAYCYNKDTIQEKKGISIDEVLSLKENHLITWINIDGLRKTDVERIGEQYGIHPLLREDILSMNQRPKMDEIDNILFCVMNMLYYNSDEKSVDQEQISLVLGNSFVITFQEDPSRDLFDPLRERLKLPASKTRVRDADYLYYTLIDTIVDNYFTVMEKLGDHIEDLEEEIVRHSSKRTLAYINASRKELIVLKRSIFPVRDIITNILKSDNALLSENNERFYKDIYDHVLQAIDLVDNYRDMIMSMHDLYINNVNLQLNEVMKVMAIVTCLLAPATVISGIFGMNFNVIPLTAHQWGFWIAIITMFGISFWMLLIFKRKKWF